MKNKTIVNVLLDETGSMMSCKEETIKGFNEYIQTLKNEKNSQINLSLTTFNSNKVGVKYLDKPIKNVEELNNDSYNPDAMTPLFDAIGKTSSQLDMRIGDKKPKVVFVVITDGQENNSTEYNKQAIQELIKEKENEGWVFTFLGAGIDAWASYNDLGLHKGNVRSMNKKDIRVGFVAAGQSTTLYARSSNRGTKTFFQND